MSSPTGSSATSADQRFPIHGTAAGRATTDRTGRCDLGCQASAAAVNRPAFSGSPSYRSWILYSNAPCKQNYRPSVRISRQ